MTTSQLEIERQGLFAFHGAPMTLIGPELSVGDPAPDFELLTTGMQPFKIADALANGTRAALLVVVPSIDTGVCSLETARFNREMENLTQGEVAAFGVSMDLPFAQKRWSASENIEGLQLLSDFKERSFGPAYGVLVKELGLLARSVFVVDKEGVIRYVEIVPEIAQEPEYDAALQAARSVAEGS